MSFYLALASPDAEWRTGLDRYIVSATCVFAAQPTMLVGGLTSGVDRMRLMSLCAAPAVLLCQLTVRIKRGAMSSSSCITNGRPGFLDD